MDVVWRQSTVTVREVVQALHNRQIAYTTVMTVMNRLFSHRILQKQIGDNGAFIYRARLTRDAWSAEASKLAIDDIIRRYGAVAMAQFIDRLDHVPAEKLTALRKKIRTQERP